MSERTKVSEPLARAPSTSNPIEGPEKPPAESQMTPPKPDAPQPPGVISRAQVEQNPAKYDNAPPSIAGEAIAVTTREPWTDKPSYEDLKKAETVRARTKDPASAGIYVAGSLVTKEGVTLHPDRIIARGETFLRALLSDEDIELKLGK
jgi:hypothetical protein